MSQTNETRSCVICTMSHNVGKQFKEQKFIKLQK